MKVKKILQGEKVLQSDVYVDEEWIDLMLTAQEIGLSKLEVRDFIRSQCTRDISKD